jgi:hypothetical protein
MPSGSALESRGIGLASMRLGAAAGGIDPVVSLRGAATSDTKTDERNGS